MQRHLPAKVITKKVMATNLLGGLSKGSKFCIVAGGTAAACGLAYLGWMALQKKQQENKDEGFVDVAKADAEDLERQVLVLGLDGSGKSSLLAALSKQDVTAAPQPTQGFNVMCIHTGKVPLKVWDIGGSANVRQYWTKFLQDTRILVFVVDAANQSRLPEAFDALHDVLGDPRMTKVPVVVVANKQDVSGAAPANVIVDALGLKDSKHIVHSVETHVNLSQEPKGIDEVRKLLQDL